VQRIDPYLSERMKQYERMNQYLSGCRMLQPCYIFNKFHHILVMTAPVARLLHCVVESVACPMRIRAVGDSRSCGRHCWHGA